MNCVDKHIVVSEKSMATHSLPNSPAHKKKRRDDLARQHSIALANLERLRRSKSCGEGRLSQPSFDFDAWPANKNDNVDLNVVGPAGGQPKSIDDKFKCGACLFLPGFGKAKVVKPRNNDGTGPMTLPAQLVSNSQRVSLERFECGSWRSSAVISCCEDEDGANGSSLFFDLPVELIRCSSSRSVDDAESPVTAAFVFDQRAHVRPKGVLKNVASGKMTAPSLGRKLQDVNLPRRHVCFSTSSTTTMPPHLPDNAQGGNDDDLNAFLQAQSA